MRTLQEMDILLRELEEMEAKYRTVREELTGIGEKCDLHRKLIIEELLAQGITSFKGSKASVSLVNKFNVKMPSDPDKREALREYLTKTGVFDNMWNLNYQTLNSWYNAEMEKNVEKGIDDDIPGLNPTHDVTLSFRRSAKQ